MASICFELADEEVQGPCVLRLVTTTDGCESGVGAAWRADVNDVRWWNGRGCLHVHELLPEGVSEYVGGVESHASGHCVACRGWIIFVAVLACRLAIEAVALQPAGLGAS